MDFYFWHSIFCVSFFILGIGWSVWMIVWVIWNNRRLSKMVEECEKKVGSIDFQNGRGEKTNNNL